MYSRVISYQVFAMLVVDISFKNIKEAWRTDECGRSNLTSRIYFHPYIMKCSVVFWKCLHWSAIPQVSPTGVNIDTLFPINLLEFDIVLIEVSGKISFAKSVKYLKFSWNSTSYIQETFRELSIIVLTYAAISTWQTPRAPAGSKCVIWRLTWPLPSNLSINERCANRFTSIITDLFISFRLTVDPRLRKYSIKDLKIQTRFDYNPIIFYSSC